MKTHSNAKAWEAEYQNPRFTTGYDKPQPTLLRFFKYLKKEHNITLENKQCLDLGSGLGRNTIYMAEQGALSASGIELSHSAHKEAQKRAEKQRNAHFINESIANTHHQIVDHSIDIAIDVTASNALSQKERTKMLAELNRVMKQGSFMYVRTLCLEGDSNAKKLIKRFPGREENSYIMPETELIETCFTQATFTQIYSPHFKIHQLIKESGYSFFNGQKYKRNFLIAYLEKI